jgi:large subunit ribosomal protein L18
VAVRKDEQRRILHRRVRKKISGTPQRPRLCVFRSLNNIYAQVIDDTRGVTLVSASTLEPDVRELLNGAGGGAVEAAKKVGAVVARKALEKGVTKVVFDRGGYQYHGRVKALADAAREAGLEF